MTALEVSCSLLCFLLLSPSLCHVMRTPVMVTAFSPSSSILIRNRHSSTTTRSRSWSGTLLLLRATTIRDVEIQKAPLQYNDKNAPFCFVASSLSTLPPGSNFLATQVWPAARVASLKLQNQLLLQGQNDTRASIPHEKFQKICEFGCGPGLPALTAASVLQQRTKQSSGEDDDGNWTVYATDLDEFALEMVRAAAKEQLLDPNFQTHQVDLLKDPHEYKDLLQDLDLAIFSDVFENEKVAIGAAMFTHYLLQQQTPTTVWVFCQSDRSQRDTYIETLRNLLNQPDLTFSNSEYQDGTRLWLYNVEETDVNY